MKLRIENSPPVSSIHVIWGIIAIMAIISARALGDFLTHLPPCLFRVMTGIPCLACGGTHCVMALAHFDVTSALRSNPLIGLALMAIIIFSLMVLIGLVIRRRLLISLSVIEKRGLRIGLILLIAINWAYLILVMK
jgi:hypothetical protein